MKTKQWLLLAVICAAGASSAAFAQEQLSGDTKLACEAIMCLSSGQRPDQCTPSIQRFFSISFRRLTDTMQGRINFLNQCPKGGDANMNTLVQGIAYGAGSCDAGTLNRTLRTFDSDGGDLGIDNTMPAYCMAYYTHPYTRLADVAPIYAGDRWVPPSEYQAAMAEYTARMQAAVLAAAAASTGMSE